MNCRPGDLARFFQPGPLRDRIIQVTTLDPDPICAGQMWLYEGRIPSPIAGHDYVSFRDCALRPIRHPGDDAVDESTVWLPPVPRGHIA
jgi:hypothetical protein